MWNNKVETSWSTLCPLKCYIMLNCDLLFPRANCSEDPPLINKTRGDMPTVVY